MLLNITLALILPIFTLISVNEPSHVNIPEKSHAYTKQEMEALTKEMKPAFDSLVKQINEKLAEGKSVELTLKDAKYTDDFSIEFQILILALVNYYKTSDIYISCVRIAKDTLLLVIETPKKEQAEANKFTI